MSRDGADMILNEVEVEHAKDRVLILNDYQLRKKIDDLFETLLFWRAEAKMWRNKFYELEKKQ